MGLVGEGHHLFGFGGEGPIFPGASQRADPAKWMEGETWDPVNSKQDPWQVKHQKLELSSVADHWSSNTPEIREKIMVNKSDETEGMKSKVAVCGFCISSCLLFSTAVLHIRLIPVQLTGSTQSGVAASVCTQHHLEYANPCGRSGHLDEW